MKIILLALFLFISIAAFCQIPSLPDSITITSEKAPFRKIPEVTSEIIFRVPSGTKALVLELDKDHFKVQIDTAVGYINYVFVGLNSEWRRYFDEYQTTLRRKEEAKKDSILKEEFRQEQLLKNEEFQKKMAEMSKKYGPEAGKKIALGVIWIGMTRAMLIESIGYPLEINRTVTANLEKEQFVYPNRKYVYVENGKVTAWQD